MRSRYDSVNKYYTTDATRGSVLMVDFRTKRYISPTTTLKVHTLVDGQELLDFVAKAYYNDESKWWHIAEQNTLTHLFPLDFVPGEKVSIPPRVL